MPVVIVSSRQLKKLSLGLILESNWACMFSNSDSDAVP